MLGSKLPSFDVFHRNVLALLLTDPTTSTSPDCFVQVPGEGPLFESDSNKRLGPKTGPLFESLPRPLLKSGLQPLGRYGNHKETISRRPEQMYTLTQDWNGLLFKLDSNKHWRAKMQPIFESFAGPLLKSGVGPLARYGNHQEIISGRLEQMYTSFDTRLEWLGEGPLFESVSNKRQGAKMGPLFESPPRPLLKSGLQPLFRYGAHQTISGTLGQVYLPSDPRLEWPGEGSLFELNLNKCWGQNVCTIRVTPGPLFMSGLGSLAR